MKARTPARGRRPRSPPAVAFSGPSGVGKTRLLARLVRVLVRRGFTVGVVKHTRHAHPFDRPGKDTDVFRRAGALAAAIEGPEEMALFGPPAGGLPALVRRLPPVDLVLAEGFRDERVPRVEVHRRRVSRDFLFLRDPRLLAVVSDEDPPGPVRPSFRPEEVEPLADLLCAHLGLRGRVKGRARRGRPPRATTRPRASRE